MTRSRLSRDQRFASSVVLLAAVMLGVWFVTVDRRARLLVVGDSLAFAAKDELVRAGVSAGYATSVDAVPGDELGDRLPAIEQSRGRRSGPLVVELGTNDIGHHVPQPEVLRRIDQAVSALVDVPCVVFVDVGVLNDLAFAAAEFNDHLRDAVAAHSNMHVYDWAADYHQHPEWTLDGIHLKSAFVGEFADGIINAVKTAC